MSIPIEPQMSVEDLVQHYPKAVGILRDHGVVCIQCGEPVWGSLQEVIEARGGDVAAILSELRRRLVENSR